MLEQTLETLYLEIENILDPEPPISAGDRPMVVGKSFYNFAYSICFLAFQCFKDENTQRGSNACATGTFYQRLEFLLCADPCFIPNAALMLAISCTNLPLRPEENIITLLQRIWDSQAPMASVLKQSEMLPEYLAKVLGKDTDQLGSAEVFNFAKAGFAAAASRYDFYRWLLHWPGGH